MSITLRNIRYFISVAEAESVSGAAQTLSISQSAITEAVKTLEQHTGARLFQRHAKGMALTPAGHQLLRHAHRILAAVADANRSLSDRPEALSGELNLGVTSMVAGYYLADLLARYRRIYPNVRFQVREDNRSYIEHLLVNGELDIAVILVSNLKDRQALESEILVRSPCRLWLPANHDFLGAESISLSDIAREPLIMLTVDEQEETAATFWARAGLQPRIVLRTASVEAVRSLVATGAGLTILPDMAFRPWSLEGDRLEAREIADQIPTVDVGLAWRRGSHLTAPVQNFLTLSREHSPSRGR